MKSTIDTILDVIRVVDSLDTRGKQHVHSYLTKQLAEKPKKGRAKKGPDRPRGDIA